MDFDNNSSQHGSILKDRVFHSGQDKIETFQKYSTVLGGFVLMLYNGSSFMIGNISPYIWSYYPECTFVDQININQYMIIITGVSNFVFANVTKMRIMNPKI